MMAPGYRANSLVAQCNAFNITHDVGNAMLNWMYGLPAARLPPFMPLPDFRDDYIGSHWAGREDAREHLYSGKQVIKTGPRKGQIVKALPEGSFSWFKAHERWLAPKNAPPDVNELIMIKNPESLWFLKGKLIDGFQKTRTYAEHGDPQTWDEEGVWHTMKLADCVSFRVG